MSVRIAARTGAVFAWVLYCLVSHWRRHPFQLVTLMLGLSLATALWSGVQAINAEARQSYDRAAAIVGSERFETIVSRSGGRFDQSLHVALRRAGWPVSPILETRLASRNGDRSLRLIGVDPITAPLGFISLSGGDDNARDAGSDEANDPPSLVAFIRPPYRAHVHPDTADRVVRRDFPDLVLNDAVAPDTVVVDIGFAQRFSQAPGELSRLLLAPGDHSALPSVTTVTGGRLERMSADDTGDLGRLTDSFHLNLTAFGFLSFAVGLFIVYGAIGLAFEQRRTMVRGLRAAGATPGLVVAGLVVELLVLSITAGMLGVVAGYAIAAALLPDIAATLRGLYGASVSGSLTLEGSWWLAGLAISVIGALLSAATSLWRTYHMPLLASARPEAWVSRERAAGRLRLIVATVLAVIALMLGIAGSGLIAGFALLGCLLLAAALALPSLIAAGLAIASRFSNGPVIAWNLADARQQLGPLSLALMALLLALAANIGVSTMVGSFRLTFLDWLDQRLSAEIYLTASDETQGLAIAAAAADIADTVLPIWSAQTRVEHWPVSVYGIRDHATYRDNWVLLEGHDGAFDAVASGEAALISEQMARRAGLSVGDALTLPGTIRDWSGDVAGIFADYGNPKGQAMIALDGLLDSFEKIDKRRYALRVAPSQIDATIETLKTRFGLGEDRIIDQNALKAYSRTVFERTFLVTAALNTLTFFVAGIALLTSFLTLSAMRLAQVAPVWAVGVTRRRLSRLEVGKAVVLAGFTCLAALPLGLLLAWVLTAIINVQAFGWRLPIHLFPLDWLQLSLAAIAICMLACLYPAWRLRRTEPGQLLKVFSDER